jgi:cellulose synthase/poly-beta-1,6-N-acetylglucosamine synthase-like glycosyltransferase
VGASPGIAPGKDRYDYDHFSRRTGPIQPPPTTFTYRVVCENVLKRDQRRRRLWLLIFLAPLAEAGLMLWLAYPSHWQTRPYDPRQWLLVLDKVVLVTIILIEFFRLVQTVSMVHGTLWARNPVPVQPDVLNRIAFVTTCVPGKEPPEMVRATLAAARRMRYPAPFDVWLLDEGDDPVMKQICAELGVKHHSRKGVRTWNTRRGAFRARTKHGNYNSWLDAYGHGYDLLAMVDTDHVPRANFLERMIGYFRDGDVAFVVGPQVYGNYDSLVTKAAESQQFLFHALVQRAGNTFYAPMLIGTNLVVRLSALRQVGGFFDSITEDMATGVAIHAARNPRSGRRWKSIYTPDVVAVGEGPSSWSDFIGQQMRWARGTFSFLGRHSWRVLWRLSPGQLFNYLVMLSFYPMAALAAMLGALSSTLYLVLGASGVSVTTIYWIMFYGDAVLLQIALYSLIRRHNVSPHEPEGSTGILGVAMGAMATPVYATALVAALLWLPARFRVTPKGDAASPDRLWTFRIHFLWALIFGGALVVSLYTGFSYPAIRIWTGLALLTSLAPVVLWTVEAVRRRGSTPTSAPTRAAERRAA